VSISRYPDRVIWLLERHVKIRISRVESLQVDVGGLVRLEGAP
jgi:hypothetical protein